jgi:hypothetical protein
MRTHAALALAAGILFATGATPALADSMSTPPSNSMASPMSSPNAMASGGMSSAHSMSSGHMAVPDKHKHKKHAAGAMQSGMTSAMSGDAMTPANSTSTQTH